MPPFIELYCFHCIHVFFDPIRFFFLFFLFTFNNNFLVEQGTVRHFSFDFRCYWDFLNLSFIFLFHNFLSMFYVLIFHNYIFILKIVIFLRTGLLFYLILPWLNHSFYFFVLVIVLILQIFFTFHLITLLLYWIF